jgi:DNA-binding MarR family transcriptional regulator
MTSKGSRANNTGADIYMRFLALSQAIRGLPSLPPLDPLEERVLYVVAAASHVGQKFSVRELMQHEDLGAPGTIHARLKSMRAKGWLELGDTEDSRRKSVELTPKAVKHFEKLSGVLVKAVAGK